VEVCENHFYAVAGDEQVSEVDYFGFRAPYPRLPTGLVPPEDAERPRRVRQVGRLITLTFGFLCAVVLALAAGPMT